MEKINKRYSFPVVSLFIFYSLSSEKWGNSHSLCMDDCSPYQWIC